MRTGENEYELVEDDAALGEASLSHVLSVTTVVCSS